MRIPTIQRSIANINDNNNYVNLQHLTNLGLYNKLILVTQKQVLELYITGIECKTLYSLRVPHTAFPNATKETTKATTNEVHVTKDRGIRTSHTICCLNLANFSFKTVLVKAMFCTKNETNFMLKFFLELGS